MTNSAELEIGKRLRCESFLLKETVSRDFQLLFDLKTLPGLNMNR